MTQEPEKLIHEGVLRPRTVDLPWDGLHIAGQRIVLKRDTDGNIDPYIQRTDGTEDNLTGEILFCRGTASLELTTSAQSITGDGDSSKVRLLLPTIGTWLVEAVVDFAVNALEPSLLLAKLYVNDSGSAETGSVHLDPAAGGDRKTVPQRWKVTTTAVNTPVELKAYKSAGAGDAYAHGSSTTLAAWGGGSGSAPVSVDHGTQSGLGDAADHAYALLLDGTRAGATGQAQDFGSNGIKADVIAESTGGSGVTADGVLLKDGVVAVGDVAFDDGTSDPLIDGTAADGTENSVARKDHVHPKHHAQAHGPSDHTSFGNWKLLSTDGSGDQQELALTAGPSATAGYDYLRSTSASGAPELQEVMRTKTITVEDPTASEDIAVCFFFQAVTIREVQAVVVGTSCTIDPYHNTDRSGGGGGTDVLNAATAITNTTTGQNLTTFTDATIPADSWLILETTAVSSCTELTVTFRYTLD